MTRIKRTKILSFNAQVAVTAEEIWAGLAGRTISHGPNIVAWEGSWGCVKVWAASWPEGASLIETVCSLAGIPWGPQAKGDLLFSTAAGASRYRPGRYRVKVRNGLAFVSTRDGPEGLPEYPLANAPRANPVHSKSGKRSRSVGRYRLRIESQG
jgi:hypothetical protein